MAKIKPIEFPLKGVANFLLVTSLPYALGIDKTTGVTWALFEEKDELLPVKDAIGNDVTDDDGKVQEALKTTYKLIHEGGTIQLTEEEFKGWGNDDQKIIELVASRIPVELE